MSPYRRYRRYDARRYAVQLQHRLGRRGTILLLLGVIWIATGIQDAIGPPSDDYALLSDRLPIVGKPLLTELRAATWVTTGAAAMVFAWRRHDAWGWVALYVMTSYRLIAYGLDATGWWSDAPSNGRGWVGVLIWLSILIVLAVCSGWPETDREGGADDTH